MLPQFRDTGPHAVEENSIVYHEESQPYLSAKTKGSRLGFWSVQRVYDRSTRQESQAKSVSDSATAELIRQRYHKKLFGGAS
jgi:hypothetical protein